MDILICRAILITLMISCQNGIIQKVMALEREQARIDEKTRKIDRLQALITLAQTAKAPYNTFKEPKPENAEDFLE